jgi:hypothetical protein
MQIQCRRGNLNRAFYHKASKVLFIFLILLNKTRVPKKALIVVIVAIGYLQ